MRGGWWRRCPAPTPPSARCWADPVPTTTPETWLDAGCSPARAAAAVHVHRQTLYHRLGRIEALTGLDLTDGDARLLLHASLRRARLTAS